MGSRMDLHRLLVEKLGSDQVYYQPPENIKMSYPAIVYTMDSIWARHADNLPYVKTKVYAITLITRNPVDPVIDELAEIPSARFDRHYIADNLHHNAFTISNAFQDQDRR